MSRLEVNDPCVPLRTGSSHRHAHENAEISSVYHANVLADLLDQCGLELLVQPQSVSTPFYSVCYC